MGCLSSTRKAELRAEIAILQAQLDALNAALLSGATDVEMYSLDTNEGKQTVKYRSLSDLIDAIGAIGSRINTLTRKVNGGGLGAMKFRRSR
jgi:hypothetical protein